MTLCTRHFKSDAFSQWHTRPYGSHTFRSRPVIVERKQCFQLYKVRQTIKQAPLDLSFQTLVAKFSTCIKKLISSNVYVPWPWSKYEFVSAIVQLAYKAKKITVNSTEINSNLGKLWLPRLKGSKTRIGCLRRACA